MRPVLQCLDVLNVVPLEGTSVRRGDVVVFPKPDADGCIAHRAIEVSSSGMRTRGDSNREPDPWLLQPSEVIGRVVSADRRGRRVRVWGGSAGMALHLLLVARGRLLQTAARPLGLAYRALAATGLLRWLGARLDLRVIRLKRPRASELQLLWGRRLVARWESAQSRWDIRPPFRLFVDQRSLASRLPRCCCSHQQSPPPDA